MTALIGDAVRESALGFQPHIVKAYEASRQYRDCRAAWLVPTRSNCCGRNYPAEVADAWERLQWPQNQQRTFRMTVKNMEVAAAYEKLVAMVVDREAAEEEFSDPSYVGWLLSVNFILSSEDDNIPPPTAVLDLFAAIYSCPDCDEQMIAPDAWRCPNGHRGYDGIAGLYHMKTDPPTPMAYGDPSEPGDFKLRSVAEALEAKRVLEVNGIPMGFSLFRKGLFSDVSRPWFTTGSDHTQDLAFCRKAKEETGARFAVHCGVQVGHLDPRTGVVY